MGQYYRGGAIRDRLAEYLAGVSLYGGKRTDRDQPSGDHAVPAVEVEHNEVFPGGAADVSGGAEYIGGASYLGAEPTDGR
jgi:hypothetical protein